MSAATRMASAAVAMVLLVAAAACSKEIPSFPKPQDVTHATGTLGTPVDDFGLSVTVLRIEPYVQSKTGFPRVAVTIRSESRRDAAAENPDVEVHCTEAHTGGDWDDESTWESEGIIVPGQVAEGQIVLRLPPKPSSSRYPVATCTNPRVEVTGTDPTDRNRQIVTSYPIPADVLEAALDAERGT